MSAISADRFTFIVFGFASFVATLGIEKQRETRRKTSWERKETRFREGGHTVQQRETRRETSSKTSETRPWEGGHTIQQRETRRKTSWETRWEKSRGHLGKADTPSNKGTHVGRQWETRPREGGHTIQQKIPRSETS